MNYLPEHTLQERRKQLEEWRHQQAEQEQLLLTLWQHRHVLQVQIEKVRERRHVLFWYRQHRERRPPPAALLVPLAACFSATSSCGYFAAVRRCSSTHMRTSVVGPTPFSWACFRSLRRVCGSKRTVIPSERFLANLAATV